MILEIILSILSFIALTECGVFAPYIDVTQSSAFTLVKYKQNYGVNTFSLAFALGGTGGCVPMWGGQTPIDDPSIIGPIQQFRAAGGDIIVSFGGAMGPYLESICSSATDLVNAYKKVLSVTGSTHIDVDIEASFPFDNMNVALATLQSQNPSITVSFTLMVQGDTYGLTDALGVNVLKNAVSHGVRVDIVNPMTMEFGSSLSSWGDAVISAAEATHQQMKGVWPQKSDQDLYAMLGVTPMLGRNFNGKIFGLTDAQKLVQWALQKNIGLLAFWSINRDHGCVGGGVSATCSGIDQQDFDFTKIFVGFANGGTVSPTGPGMTTTPTVSTTAPTTAGTTPQTTTPGSGGSGGTVICNSGNNGKFYPDPTKCPSATFYQCSNNSPVTMSCGGGTYFNPTANVCDYTTNVKCPYQG